MAAAKKIVVKKPADISKKMLVTEWKKFEKRDQENRPTRRELADQFAEKHGLEAEAMYARINAILGQMKKAGIDLNGLIPLRVADRGRTNEAEISELKDLLGIE